MTNNLDILNIDALIHKNFEEEKKKINEYDEKLKDVEISLKIENLRPRVVDSLREKKKNLIGHIDNIKNNTLINFYITESVILLDKYKKMLEAPMKMNFVGKPIKNHKEKQKIINEYLLIASKYCNIDIEPPEKKQRITCTNCPNKNNFDIIDINIYICVDCSAQQSVLKNISSYKDIDRINISQKYMYDRKIHFRDCIKQYQGKQNSTIHQKVYDDLETQFQKHHLLIETENASREKRFSKITKGHITMFLKELDYTKHYENINLIYYNFTGNKPDDISHLEDKLMADFDILTDLYDKRFRNTIDRKNFINTQYVLYQLLSRHKHPCVKEDFSVLKTIDRKSFHDDICQTLFEEIGWNLKPFF